MKPISWKRVLALGAVAVAASGAAAAAEDLPIGLNFRTGPCGLNEHEQLVVRAIEAARVHSQIKVTFFDDTDHRLTSVAQEIEPGRPALATLDYGRLDPTRPLPSAYATVSLVPDRPEDVVQTELYLRFEVFNSRLGTVTRDCGGCAPDITPYSFNRAATAAKAAAPAEPPPRVSGADFNCTGPVSMGFIFAPEP